MQKRANILRGGLSCSIIAFSAAGCSLPLGAGFSPSTTATLQEISTPSPREEAVVASPTPTFTLTPTPIPSETPFPEPGGCKPPPEDMSILEINGEEISARTMAMLEHAAELYGGEIDITGKAITQGSYSNSVSLSFGTHDGGGAVDLSVIRVENDGWVVLWDDIEPLVKALREAGFAAWFRAYGELAPGSPLHIHAVAIGDPDLSESARDQLAGPFGYFRGFTGIPQEDGIPDLDRHGGPVLCEWMVDLGYENLVEDK